jgi:hypothetical protein
MSTQHLYLLKPSRHPDNNVISILPEVYLGVSYNLRYTPIISLQGIKLSVFVTDTDYVIDDGEREF